MNKNRFDKLIEAIRRTASKRGGWVLNDDINELLADDVVDIDAIERTVAALRAQGIEVVLAEMPVPNRYVALHPAGAEDVTRAHEAVGAIADLLGLPVIDLRYGFTDDDFVDYTHLAAGPAADLTERLATELSRAEPSAAPAAVDDHDHRGRR